MRQRLAVGGGGWRLAAAVGDGRLGSVCCWNGIRLLLTPITPITLPPPRPPPSLSPAVQLPGTDSDGGGRLRAAEPAEGRREGRRRRRRRSPREAAAAEWGRRSGLGMSPRQVRVHMSIHLSRPPVAAAAAAVVLGKVAGKFWWRRR